MSSEIVRHADVTNRGVALKTIDEMWRVAEYISKSGLVPAQFQRTEAVFTAIQFGLELGLAPMQAVRGIYVVNGKPVLYGDLMLGLCMRRDDWDATAFDERYEKGVATCIVGRIVRQGQGTTTTKLTIGEFSEEDAKRAGLLGKQGPWALYPKRMQKMRARAFALRDAFSDVLSGVYAREEMDASLDVEYVEVTPPAESGPLPLPAKRKRGGQHESPPPVADKEATEALEALVDAAKVVAGVADPDPESDLNAPIIAQFAAEYPDLAADVLAAIVGKHTKGKAEILFHDVAPPIERDIAIYLQGGK